MRIFAAYMLKMQIIMKKSLFNSLLLAIACILGMSACNGCSKGKGEAEKPDFTAGAEHIQALHRQTMNGLIGGERYEWRNSKVLFTDSIKWENLGELKVKSVTDVFYYCNGDGPHVQIITSDAEEGTTVLPVIHDVWIEDANLSDKEIKLTVADVLARLKEWNGVLPPANSMSLRYPVGPMECNAQWVIGNAYDVIFVDAVTADISNWNPAFNPNNKAKGGDFGKPLGEWP